MESPKEVVQFLQTQFLASKLNLKSLYRSLLRNCLLLDMLSKGDNITDSTNELLSEESKVILKVFSKQWGVGEVFQIIIYLELLNC